MSTYEKLLIAMTSILSMYGYTLFSVIIFSMYGWLYII